MQMKTSLITTLRNQNSSTAQFREAAELVAELLAWETAQTLDYSAQPVQTPLATTEGSYLEHSVVLIPILRAGLSMLNPFLKVFKEAAVGFIGLKRDESTAMASLYYQSLPVIGPSDYVILLDPMLATGGSCAMAIDLLLEQQVQPKQIRYVSALASSPGLRAVRKRYPDLQFVIAQEDPELNAKKYIVPGLGDWGDRYFKT